MKIEFGARSAFGAAGLVSIATALGTFYILPPESRYAVLAFFQEKMRQPLFAGFLTASTFLFSLKTFIVVNMKQHVYGTPEYEREWRGKLALNPSMKRYEPLRNFALLLFLSVLVSLACAISQFTIGLVDAPLAAFLCLALSIWSLLMIFFSLILLQMNLRSWFRFLDET